MESSFFCPGCGYRLTVRVCYDLQPPTRAHVCERGCGSWSTSELFAERRALVAERVATRESERRWRAW